MNSRKNYGTWRQVEYHGIINHVFQIIFKVANDEVDMALGSDQGGSIRIPASWCGIVGLKPTFGLVPYTGIIAIEPSIDHVGPMARTVTDVALLLEVSLNGIYKSMITFLYGF